MSAAALSVRVGIDLGTTFCCVAYVGSDGIPCVLDSSDGKQTTPSVICFDGDTAVVGSAAPGSCAGKLGQLFEFVKRSTGKPVSHAEPSELPTAPFVVAGKAWGVVGMQALMLRKLRQDALVALRRRGVLRMGQPDDEVEVEAIITVPAYYGDIERLQTREAAICAGISVLGVINEPTAAALTYRYAGGPGRRLVVFDLGGGTFDVSIVDVGADGAAHVIATDGSRELGGKDVDDIILGYLTDCYVRQNNQFADSQTIAALRRVVPEYKHALSGDDAVAIRLDSSDGIGGIIEATLHRAPPPGYNAYESHDVFYLEERATNLFARIRSLSEAALSQATIPLPGGVTRQMQWSDLDQVVLVGGSCRLPVVGRLVGKMTGLTISEHPDGFDYDTAVAVGAALFAANAADVRDVVSHGIGVGVDLRVGARRFPRVHPLVKKNAPLPARCTHQLEAEANAKIELFQGDTEEPHPANRRGVLNIDNAAGPVTLELAIDVNGHLHASARYRAADGIAEVTRELDVQNANFDVHLAELKSRVMAVRLVH